MFEWRLSSLWTVGWNERQLCYSRTESWVIVIVNVISSFPSMLNHKYIRGPRCWSKGPGPRAPGWREHLYTTSEPPHPAACFLLFFFFTFSEVNFSDVRMARDAWRVFGVWNKVLGFFSVWISKYEKINLRRHQNVFSSRRTINPLGAPSPRV